MAFYLIASDWIRLDASSELLPRLYCVASLPDTLLVPYSKMSKRMDLNWKKIKVFHSLYLIEECNGGEERNTRHIHNSFSINSSKHLCIHALSVIFSNKLMVHYRAIKTPTHSARRAWGLNCRGCSHCGDVWPCLWWVTWRGIVYSPLALCALWQAEVGVSESARAVVLSARLILILFQTVARVELNRRPKWNPFPLRMKMFLWLGIFWFLFFSPTCGLIHVEQTASVCWLHVWGWEWLCFSVYWQEMVSPCGEG